MARGDAGRDGCRGVGVRPGAHRDRPPAPRRTAHLVARRRGNDGAGARPVGPEECPPALRPVVGRVRSALRAPCRGRLGCGSFSDLGDLRRWVEGLGGSVTATLPLFAQFLDESMLEPSLYSPASRLFWNETYIDVTRAPGLEGIRCSA